MHAIVFIGCQASGKSTFYLQNFVNSHIRINLDMLRTRHREDLLLRACLEMKQPFVVDNTNPTRQDRQRYLIPALAAGFSVTGYYFASNIEHLLQRNRQRSEAARVPEVAVKATYRKLELPALSEGFTALSYVRMLENGEFALCDWQD